MNNNKMGSSTIFRFGISFVSIILPAVFLIKGIYGSFLFTFSIPLLWQVGLSGKPIESLGLRSNYLKSSIITGVVSGVLLGFLGGIMLKLLGISGYVYTNLHKLQCSIGSLVVTFPLQKELGYRLLTAGNSLTGIGIYFIFSVFVIGLGEELFWRGFIQQKISGYLPINISIWLTAILFALAHFYIFIILPVNLGIFFLIITAISGVVWGYLFKFFNNLWPVAISHGITAFIIWKYCFFSP